MPDMMCKKCGKEAHYRNTRGSRISDFTCTCGGKFGAAVRSLSGPLEFKKTKGIPGTIRECALCGRKRKETGSNVRLITEDKVVDAIYGSYPTYFGLPILVPAGSIICWYHHRPAYWSRPEIGVNIPLG